MTPLDHNEARELYLRQTKALDQCQAVSVLVGAPCPWWVTFTPLRFTRWARRRWF